MDVAGIATINILDVNRISPDGVDFGTAQYFIRATGSGTWEWAYVPGLFSVNNILNGFNVSDEGLIVGTAGSITQLDFRGNNVVAFADPQPNGIATVRISDNPDFLTLNVSGISTLAGITTVTGETLFAKQLNVAGVSTFVGLTTFVSDVYIGGNLFVKDDLVFDEFTARNINVTGISTLGIASATTLYVTGVSTFRDRVIFDSTNSIQIPVGTLAQRDPVGVAVTGQIRYNSEYSTFEGFGPGNSWGSLGGVKDVDGNTYIIPESYPGANENILYFYTNGTEKVRITSTGSVAIGTTQPTAKLHVVGDARITGLTSVTNLEISGTVGNGATTGNNGQYLKSTGIGVTWADFPTLRTTGIVTATNNQTSFSFGYNVNFLDVFVNGVKLTGSEYTATNGTSVTLGSPAFENDIVEFVSYNTTSSGGSGGGGGATILDDLSDVVLSLPPAAGETLTYNGSNWVNDYTVTASTSTTSQTAIHTLSASTYRSVEYTIQATQGTNYHVTKILCIHDGTLAYPTEYGIVYTNTSLATFDVDVSGGNMRLLVTPASSSSTTYKIKFTAIKV